MRQRVGGIIIRGDKVLLMHRNKHGSVYYCFPGGGVEDSETKEVALQREIKEETNLDFSQSHLLCEFEYIGQWETFYLIKDAAGEAEIIGEEKERRSDDNTYKLVWLPISELEKNTVYPEETVKQFLNYYKNIPVS